MSQSISTLQNKIVIVLFAIGIILAGASFLNLPSYGGSLVADSTVLQDMAYSITFAIFSATSFIGGFILATNEIKMANQ